MNNQNQIDISFIINDKEYPVKANIGDTILDIKHCNEELLECLECACEGSLACSTCHVILDEEHYCESFEDGEDEPSDEENDMLDLAPNVSKTSRLGCQVRMTKKLDGAIFTIPSENRNFSHKKVNSCDE